MADALASQSTIVVHAVHRPLVLFLAGLQNLAGAQLGDKCAFDGTAKDRLRHLEGVFNRAREKYESQAITEPQMISYGIQLLINDWQKQVQAPEDHRNPCLVSMLEENIEFLLSQPAASGFQDLLKAARAYVPWEPVAKQPTIFPSGYLGPC